jgi:hypothetical protein
VSESGEATECTVGCRIDHAVTRYTNCEHVEDSQPSCCDAFER